MSFSSYTITVAAPPSQLCSVSPSFDDATILMGDPMVAGRHLFAISRNGSMERLVKLVCRELGLDGLSYFQEQSAVLNADASSAAIAAINCILSASRRSPELIERAACFGVTETDIFEASSGAPVSTCPSSDARVKDGGDGDSPWFFFSALASHLAIHDTALSEGLVVVYVQGPP